MITGLPLGAKVVQWKWRTCGGVLILLGLAIEPKQLTPKILLVPLMPAPLEVPIKHDSGAQYEAWCIDS